MDIKHSRALDHYILHLLYRKNDDNNDDDDNDNDNNDNDDFPAYVRNRQPCIIEHTDWDLPRVPYVESN